MTRNSCREAGFPSALGADNDVLNRVITGLKANMITDELRTVVFPAFGIRLSTKATVAPVAAPLVIGWVIKEPQPGRYVASNEKYPALKAELEMYGAGQPKILEWKLLKDALTGIGLLKYYAGDFGDGQDSSLEYVAIVDTRANKVISVEPHTWGDAPAQWNWQAVSVVITDPDGNKNEVQLRKVRQRAPARDDFWGFDRPDTPPADNRRAALGYPWIFREIKHYRQTGMPAPPPTVGERVAVCRMHLAGALSWNDVVQGLNEMRGRYSHYLKGLPGIQEYVRRLVRLPDAAAVGALLDEIGEVYSGFETAAEPIRLVNYHSNCTL